MNLQSIQIGLPKTYGDPEKKAFDEKEWRTGLFKAPVEGPVDVTNTGIVGDGQADLKVHGGPDKAICVYPREHFPYWAESCGLHLTPGAFGENFSTIGITESEICIGDRFSLGETVFEVSQPRQPCWKIARRWGIKKLPHLVQESGRTGWYFRVVEEGPAFAPALLQLIERPNPSWTIARSNQVMHHEKKNRDAAAELSKAQGLSESWRSSLAKRVSNHSSNSERVRLEGADD